MHEYSVVASLMELCEQYVQSHNAQKVVRVVVEIGERSGVNADLFRSAFENYKEGGICAQSSLEIKITPITIACKACEQVFQPNHLEYGNCIYCQSTHTYIKEGNEMKLLTLELE